MDEVRTNLEEAVSLVLETNRALSEESLKGTSVIRETMPVTAE
jgi:predicted RNase H-like HicB family nuclease